MFPTLFVNGKTLALCKGTALCIFNTSLAVKLRSGMVNRVLNVRSDTQIQIIKLSTKTQFGN